MSVILIYCKNSSFLELQAIVACTNASLASREQSIPPLTDHHLCPVFIVVGENIDRRIIENTGKIKGPPSTINPFTF